MCNRKTRIFELLKPLNITWVFVFRTVKLILDTRGAKIYGRPRVVRTPQVINAVRKQISMAQEMDIAPRTTSHIIKQKLGLSNHKQENVLPLH